MPTVGRLKTSASFRSVFFMFSQPGAINTTGFTLLSQHRQPLSCEDMGLRPERADVCRASCADGACPPVSWSSSRTWDLGAFFWSPSYPPATNEKTEGRGASVLPQSQDRERHKHALDSILCGDNRVSGAVRLLEVRDIVKNVSFFFEKYGFCVSVDEGFAACTV